jgi:DnaJ family protein A protein 2
MNFNQAKQVLNLPDDFNQEIVKQNYHKLSLKHHPDKGGDPDDFVKITAAYELLTKKPEPKTPITPTVINLNDLFRSFVNTGNNFFKKSPIFGFKKEINLSLTPQEFLQGTTREIETVNKTNCGCEQKFCDRCRGFTFNTCNECLGAGIVQQCEKCINGIITTRKIVTLQIPKTNLASITLENTIVHLKIETHKYFVKDNKLYYRYNITLKESLTGFKKTFKDPFQKEHLIVSKSIVKPNDGYLVCENFYLLFNIVYPKQLLTQLKNIDF